MRYNNLITKADVQDYGIDLKFGKDDSINKQIPNISSDPTNDTGEKGVVVPQSQDKPVTTAPTPSTLPAAPAPTSGKEHEDNKSTLIFMGLFIGLVVLMTRS